MSVHSNDGITWLTKLERIGKLAATNKETVFSNLGHIIDVDMLTDNFYKLDGNKAVGIDGITKEIYGRNLAENIEDLMKRIRRGAYRPKPSRKVEIPKEDGSTRPLAIACIEDKLVQTVVNKILTKLYEPIFLPCSYGFRPNKSCHDALRSLREITHQYRNGAVVEIDIQRYFNTIPHNELKQMLKKKISDKRFLRLLDVLITTPTEVGVKQHKKTEGCQQGSIVSPILSNIYLHYVIDEWFTKIEHSHIRGEAKMVRFADDMVFIFQLQYEAKRFYQTLPKRLQKYGLRLHEEKSNVILSGSLAAYRALRAGNRLASYNFLGFTCYWGKSRNNRWHLMYTSRRDRFSKTLKRLRDYLWKNINAPIFSLVIKRVIRSVRGWINYHGISNNSRRVGSFIYQAGRILFRWLNRRGRKKPLNWNKFNGILKSYNYPQTWKTIPMYIPAR